MWSLIILLIQSKIQSYRYIQIKYKNIPIIKPRASPLQKTFSPSFLSTENKINNRLIKLIQQVKNFTGKMKSLPRALSFSESASGNQSPLLRNKKQHLFQHKSVQMLFRKKNHQKKEIKSIKPVQSQVQEEKKSPEYKIFEQIYERKFVNAVMVPLAQKRKTFANKGKPSKQQLLDLGVPRNKSIGSLLPRLKELELISKSDKKTQKNAIKQKIEKLTEQDKNISQLGIYINKKQIQREQQLNLIFLTEQNRNSSNSKTPDTEGLSEKLLNDQFMSFVFKSQPQHTKSLRSILNASDNVQISQTQRQMKLGKQKQELTGIAKNLVMWHQTADQRHAAIFQQKNDDDLDFEEEACENIEQSKIEGSHKQSNKDISWVLKQCKQYQKKFKIRTNSHLPKKNHHSSKNLLQTQ